jgi:hypothetical protein
MVSRDQRLIITLAKLALPAFAQQNPAKSAYSRRKRELLPANPPYRSRSAVRWCRVSALDDGACRINSCTASCTLGKALSHNTAELESHVPYWRQTKGRHR